MYGHGRVYAISILPYFQNCNSPSRIGQAVEQPCLRTLPEYNHSVMESDPIV